MKANRFLIVGVFILVFVSVFTSCEYDVAEPLWEKEFTVPPTPKINQVEPANEAKPGINSIKITGENFIGISDSCIVYFDNTRADVMSVSATSITVRRPNIVKDASTIKIVPNKALIVAKYSPFKIYPVASKYGSFLDNLQLSVVAVDQNENLYVIEAVSKSILKVTPNGDKSSIAVATRNPTDASIGPDGKLYLPGNNRAIDQVDLTTGEVKRWTQLASGKVVKVGDWDANGYFYTAGNKTDIVIVSSDLIDTHTSGVYTAEEVLVIRVFNDNVFVASRVGTQPAKIWKHKISAMGTLGQRELVFDFNSQPEFSSRTVKGISLSSNGNLYIATDAANPILILEPNSTTLDYFYKDILTPYCKYFSWGTGNNLYMITGDATAGAEWNVYKVDMGSTSVR